MDDRLRITSFWQLEAWVVDHVVARLAWDHQTKGDTHGVNREDDRELAYLTESLIPASLHHVMHHWNLGPQYGTFAIVGLTLEQQRQLVGFVFAEMVRRIEARHGA